MDTEESSSIIDSLGGKMDKIKEDERLDIVTALTTPLHQNVIKKHAETLKKLKSQEKEIRQQQRQIDELNFELSMSRIP
jgi:septal ring factor EnvC (AmiA/AmiB activator)